MGCAHTQRNVLINKKSQGLKKALFVVSQNNWGTFCFALKNIIRSLKQKNSKEKICNYYISNPLKEKRKLKFKNLKIKRIKLLVRLLKFEQRCTNGGGCICI